MNINVLLDTSPLQTGSKVRGIGMYTSQLQKALEANQKLNVFAISSRKELRKLRSQHPEFTKENTVLHYPFFDLFFSTLPYFRPFKTVVTVHDVIPLKFPQSYKPGIRGKIRFFKQAYKLRSVEAVITDSHASYRDIRDELHIPEPKLHVTYLAASTEIHHQSDATIAHVRKTLKLPRNYVLYVGDINYNKNIPQLIKMVKFLPNDLELVCVGKNFFPQDIPEWNWIEAQIALSDVSDRIHFIPHLGSESTESLSALYSDAVAYIQPSLYEGFGLPVLEAMQAKCPVIAAQNSSLIEVVGEHGILVEPCAENFADAVKKIISWSENHRTTVLRDAYHWSQTFRWEKTAAETAKIYEEVLGAK